LPIMFRQLQPKIGFGWVNRIFGFIMLALLISAFFLLRPDPSNRRPKGPLFDPSAIKEPPFVILFFGLFCSFLGYWIPTVFITPFAEFSLKTSTTYAFNLLAILNAGSCAGRVLPAFIAHRLGPCSVLVGGAFGLGILILAWIRINDIAGITVWAVLVGFMSGITVAIPAAVVPLLSPTPNVIGARTGMAWSGAAFAGLVGSPIAGLLVNKTTNDYTHGQIFGGAACLLGGVLLMYPAFYIARRDRRTKAKDDPAVPTSEVSSPIELGVAKSS
jgi:predicted MFS family arabinose efflux permease